MSANGTNFIGCPCARNWKNCGMLDEHSKQLPIRVKPNPHNEWYLRAKREKMGHLLEFTISD
jgi:hypothetical protein